MSLFPEPVTYGEILVQEEGEKGGGGGGGGDK